MPPRGKGGSPDEFRHEALWLMAVLGFRALRAAMSITSSGYADQATAQVRLNIELQARAQKVADDESGEAARQWLVGRAGGSGARLIGQDFWEILSGPPHAVVRGVLDWVAISKEDGTTDVVLGPERRSELANSMLTFIAGALRDVGHFLASVAGAPENGLAFSDAEIKAAYDRFLPGAGLSPSGDHRCNPCVPSRTG